jgi:SAF domain.
MRKLFLLLSASCLCFLCFALPLQMPYQGVDWSKRVVCTKTSVKAGDKLSVSVLQEKSMPAAALKTDAIKSISSAVDRVARRDIATGEQLFYSDFGAQPVLIGRPHPEFEVY